MLQCFFYILEEKKCFPETTEKKLINSHYHKHYISSKSHPPLLPLSIIKVQHILSRWKKMIKKKRSQKKNTGKTG